MCTKYIFSKFLSERMLAMCLRKDGLTMLLCHERPLRPTIIVCVARQWKWDIDYRIIYKRKTTNQPLSRAQSLLNKCVSEAGIVLYIMLSFAAEICCL